jgi:hypothetical protein
MCFIETITILFIVNIAVIVTVCDIVIGVVIYDRQYVRLYVYVVMSSYSHVSHVSYLFCVCSVTYDIL